jgi:hypothetical protein
MHVSRVACLLLGAWVGGSMFMTAVATQNFRSVDRTIESEEDSSRKAIESIGGEEAARVFLRHHEGETNRRYFVAWEYAQLAIGGALFLLLLFGAAPRKWAILVSLLMLLLVGVMRLSVTPSITSLGRELDFLPAGQEGPIRNQFRAWHSAYGALEATKLAFAVALAAMLVAGNGARRR